MATEWHFLSTVFPNLDAGLVGHIHYFTWTVWRLQVVSGDCLVVNDAAGGAERRVFLSSIRAPRVGRRNEKPEPYAVEAKEFLRNRLIGAQGMVPDFEDTRASRCRAVPCHACHGTGRDDP